MHVAPATRTTTPTTSRSQPCLQSYSPQSWMTTDMSSERAESRSARSHQSRASVRHRTKKADEAEPAPKKPDVEELRRIRAAYFARPASSRSRVTRPRIERVAEEVRSAKGSEHRRRKTSSHSRSSTKSHRTSGSKDDAQRSSEGYVYAARSTPDIGRDEPRQRTAEQEATPRRHRSKRSLLSAENLSTIDDTEVTPDDSISVVAERQSKRHSTSHSHSKTSLRRSRTAPSGLDSVPEAPDEPSPKSVSLKAPKRQSILLGNLLRRNTSSAPAAPPRLVDCLTCGSDDVPRSQSAKLACKHRMCHTCLKRVFEMSVKDPAHMPPRCCTEEHIPLEHVDKLFDIKFKALWNRKYQEYHTKNRVYCVAPKCGEWIKPSHIRTYQGRKYAQCQRCKTKVCVLCNNKMHRMQDCPQDPEIAKLVAQAKDKGWQRCFNCSAMVELEAGCNHMTCRCMAEFCMICGSKWKTCECPWFNYSSLPNPDRLNDMRVPEPIRALYRRVFDAARVAAPPAVPASGGGPAEQRNDNRDARTYADELEGRRRQERLDADLARRMQLASFMNPDDDLPTPHQRANAEVYGVGNAAGHLMNDDFVQTAPEVAMDGFGDANMGRRGERASGRRRRARDTEADPTTTGLAPNFLGDQSVLGFGPPRRTQRIPG